jgi:hypothetical protein
MAETLIKLFKDLGKYAAKNLENQSQKNSCNINIL